MRHIRRPLPVEKLKAYYHCKVLPTKVAQIILLRWVVDAVLVQLMPLPKRFPVCFFAFGEDSVSLSCSVWCPFLDVF